MKTISMFLVWVLLNGAAAIGAKSAVTADNTEVPMTCTFTIKGTFNGTVVDVTISVSDVNAIECALLKAGVKKAIQ